MADEAASKAQQGHYQVACARVFEGLYGEAPDAGVTHPNSYLVESLDIVARRNQAASGLAQPPTSVSPAFSNSGSHAQAATPSIGTVTPLQGHFIRTPMQMTTPSQLTPQGGQLPPSSGAPDSNGTPGLVCTPHMAPLVDSPIQGLQAARGLSGSTGA